MNDRELHIRDAANENLRRVMQDNPEILDELHDWSEDARFRAYRLYYEMKHRRRNMKKLKKLALRRSKHVRSRQTS